VIYGAWLAGIGVAGVPGVPAVLLLIGITALALANGPLAVLSRAVGGRRRQAATWLLLYAGVAGAALGPLVVVFRMRFLLPFAAAAALFLGLRLLLLGGRDQRSLPAELVGVAGLSMVGPVAQAATLGRLEAAALVLWLLLALFFASGIFYVRMRIREMLASRMGRRRSGAFWPCLLYHLVLPPLLAGLALAGLVPVAVLLAFLPALWRAARGLQVRQAPLDVRRLGWAETRLTLTFVLLLVGAFRLAHLAP
jgi:hypothetical protein